MSNTQQGNPETSGSDIPEWLQPNLCATTVRNLLKITKKPGEFSTSELIDRLRTARAVKDVVEKWDKLLSEVVKSRYTTQMSAYKEGDDPIFLGGHYTPGFNAVFVHQDRLDKDALVKWLEDNGHDPESVLREIQKPVEFFQFKKVSEE